MDKLTKLKFLPSNLPWLFNYNQKIAEEIKPAGTFDRLSKNKHTNRKNKPKHTNQPTHPHTNTKNCATVSQDARKETQPELCLPWQCLQLQLFSATLEEPTNIEPLISNFFEILLKGADLHGTEQNIESNIEEHLATLKLQVVESSEQTMGSLFTIFPR